ncbi:nicotinamidase-related amidase [Rhizobium sp. BK650]|uniref:cysteine hydrolase family protein n=1 Tax=Rhizobium sp. BK650 TaxID=2586990 RepID=UPI001608054F|nr:cysteine hydrolase [Rhizobium sp. BK650]MBB3657646.1 nicotinamidase-related amidase [Rhizobium sp. BK650]
MIKSSPDHFRPVDATPYTWPFDHEWSCRDTGLLLLGFQSGIVRGLAAQAARETATRLVEAASCRGLAIIASRRGQDPESGALARRRAVLGDQIPARGSQDWQFDESISLPAAAIVVDHAGDNAFFRTDLEDTLRRRGIRNLLVVGLPTDGLVHATQRAANDMGFECLTVIDACKGTSPGRHEAQLRITTFGNGLFGAIAPASAVEAALGISQRSMPFRRF